MRARTVSAQGHDLRLFMVAGEHSGDALGGKLMAALNERRRGRIRYLGVGGPAMAAQGLVSQFPLEDVAVMGPGAIISRLPLIVRRISATASAAVAAEPERRRHHRQPGVHPPDRQAHPPAAAGHSHHRLRLAQRVGVAAGPRAQDAPTMSTTSWRCGRSSPRRTHRLGGPPCSFVGHPLIERHPWIAGARHRRRSPSASTFGRTRRCLSCCPAAAPPRCRA